MSSGSKAAGNTSVAPICAALGLPVEVLGILVAVEIIPDIFRTLGNVIVGIVRGEAPEKHRQTVLTLCEAFPLP